MIQLFKKLVPHQFSLKALSTSSIGSSDFKGFSPKVPRVRFVSAVSKQEKKQVSKKERIVIKHIHKGFTLAVADESIFTHGSLVRKKMWTADRVRPIVTVTGSHQRT